MSGEIGCWLTKFLDSLKRQQAFAVDDRISGLSPAISGVQQETVLGQILL